MCEGSIEQADGTAAGFGLRLAKVSRSFFGISPPDSRPKFLKGYGTATACSTNG